MVAAVETAGVGGTKRATREDMAWLSGFEIWEWVRELNGWLEEWDEGKKRESMLGALWPPRQGSQSLPERVQALPWEVGPSATAGA